MKVTVPRSSYFVFTGGAGRVRRPRDVLTAVLGLAFTLWAIARVEDVPDWASSVSDLVANSPGWVGLLLTIGYLTSLLYALGITAALLFRTEDRGSAVRDVVVAVVGVMAVVVLVSFIVNDAWPYILPEIDLQNPTPRFPVTRVAIVTAVLLVASPYLTQPVRRLGWVAIVTTALASVGLQYGTPIHTLGSFGIGLLVAGLLLVVVGTPRGYPSPAAVGAGLTQLGVEHSGLVALPEQNWGLVRFGAIDTTGSSIRVKVHGRDSFDSQLAAKLWRTLIYRELSGTVGYSRLQMVEHEAFVNLMAHKAGVPVSELRAAGSASSELALIAFNDDGTPLDELDVSRVTDELLVRVWHSVAGMHRARISHGSLSASAVRVVDDNPVLTDFDLGSAAPSEEAIAADAVELLFSLTLLVGAARAAKTVVEGLGPEPVEGLMPYLQVPALSPTTRKRAPKPKKVMGELQQAITELTGADMPDPVKLRRVDLKSLAMVAVLLLIASALIPAFTQVDYAAIWDVLEAADWALVTVAVVVGHLQFIPQATATMFAVPTRLPFWPLITLQTASQFISLAIPSAAGRVAMNAAFLHKFGVSVTVAVAQGAIDGFSGFLVQAGILIVILLVGDVNLNLDLDSSDIPWLAILTVVALIALGVVVAVLRIRSLRDRLLPIVKQAWSALAVVLGQPSRAFGLLGSNFVYWNLLGITLWLLLQAVGMPLSYGAALFTAAGTSLLAGFMPIPGGVGVAEATMTAILASLGIDHNAAFAVTAVYRIITFYLPALEGFFGTRWLERNDYI